MSGQEAQGPLSQPVWLLELIISGQLETRIAGREWQSFGAGEGWVYAPGTIYFERVTQSDLVCRSICLFFEPGIKQTHPAWERFNQQYLLLEDAAGLLKGLMQKCMHHRGLSAVDDLVANACFLELMALLLRANLHGATLRIGEEESGPPDFIAHSNRFMRARLHQPLTITEIADEVGLSVSGFAHAYKRQVGLSPMVALRQMRVEAVKVQLLRDRLTLAQIAHETGFTDAFHLSRSFKQETGLPPSSYRRLLRKRVLGHGHKQGPPLPE